MQREIKFRAWDKNNNGWLKKAFVLNSHGSVFFEYVGGGHIQNYIEVMQFTGLKDKNGKEIYEGDVVRRWCSSEDFCARNKMTGTVEWKDTEFWVNGHDKEIKVKGGTSDGQMVHMGTVHSWAGMHSCMRDGRLEVIGNIYEDPELNNNKHE